MDKIIRNSDSDAASKMLSLMGETEVTLTSITVTTGTDKSTTTGSMTFLGQTGWAATLTEYTGGDLALELEAGSTAITLGGMSSFLNLNPLFSTLYGQVSFSNIKVVAGAAMADNKFEALSIEGTETSPTGLDADFLGIPALPITELSLSASVKHAEDGVTRVIRPVINAKLDIEGETMDISLLVPPAGMGTWELALVAPGVDLSLGDLIKLVVGTTAFSGLPEQVKTIPAFNLGYLEIHFDPNAKELHQLKLNLDSVGEWTLLPGTGSDALLVLKDIGVILDLMPAQGGGFEYLGSLTGTAKIGEFEVIAFVPLPLTGELQLYTNTVIPITDLSVFSNLLAGTGYSSFITSGDFEDNFDLSIHQMGVGLDLGTSSLSVLKEFSLDGRAALTLHLAHFSMEMGMDLLLEKQAGISDLQYILNAHTDLVFLEGTQDEFGLTLTGTRNSTEEGWALEGKSTESIPIGSLLIELAGKFSGQASLPGQPLPNFLSGLTLNNLSAKFNTHTWDYQFSGLLENFPFSNSDTELNVVVNHTQDNGAEKTFAGKITLNKTSSDPKVFAVTFSENPTSSLMVATYTHSAEQGAFDLGAFLDELLPAPVLPLGLEISMNSATLIYLDGNPDKFVFSIDMGEGIDLTHLPLVGTQFSSREPIRLSYQIQYASANFSTVEIAEINAILPQTVHPFPAAGVSEGLGLAVSMQVGNELIPLTLDLATSGSAEDPNTGSYPTQPDNTPIIPPGQDPVVPKSSGTHEGLHWFDLQKKVGPVHFNRIGMAYSGRNLVFSLDAAFTAGGLEISLDGLSVSSPLTRFEPHFGLRGIGVDYQEPGLEIGGAFLKEHVGPASPEGYDEYDGVALIKTEELSLSAIGSYAYVDGHPSLFIYTATDTPLGGPAFFFITGFSFGFGYNRSLRMPAIEKVLEFPLVAEAMNGKSLPADAGKEALVEELEAIHTYLPPTTGAFFLAAGINFTTFKLVNSSLLLVAEFGNRLEFDLLGVSTLIVPPESGKTPLAVVQMALKGSYDPEAGFLAFRGQLTPASHVLSRDCKLTGGFAFYSWTEGVHKGDFVFSIGGYHPDFRRPEHYPTVPRLGFNWRVDSHTQVKGDMYFALCAHALMAGGHLDVTYERGSLSAYFRAAADFLVAWKPYHYEASLSVHIGGRYTYHFWGTHHISVDVGADLRIWGPDFGGYAKIHLWICSIEVSFGASRNSTPDPISWSNFQSSFLPANHLNSLKISKGLVSKGAANSLGVVNPKELVLHIESFVPIKAVSTTIPRDIEDTEVWNTDFGIGPMKIRPSQLISSQTLSIEKYNGTGWVDVGTHFSYRIRKQQKPAGLWGQKLRPSVNDPEFIKNTLSGFEIEPASGPVPGVSKTVPQSFIQYETRLLPYAIRWENRTAFTDAGLSDAQARNSINTSIQENTSRDNLLTVLGIEIPVDLSNTVANDLTLAPQVAQ